METKNEANCQCPKRKKPTKHLYLVKQSLPVPNSNPRESPQADNDSRLLPASCCVDSFRYRKVQNMQENDTEDTRLPSRWEGVVADEKWVWRGRGWGLMKWREEVEIWELKSHLCILPFVEMCILRSMLLQTSNCLANKTIPCYSLPIQSISHKKLRNMQCRVHTELTCHLTQ